jgi:hypothetical protein
MEHPDESDVGYPEEQPAEVAEDAKPSGGGSSPREGARHDRPGTGDDEDDGTATGNPDAAGPGA